MGKNPWNTVWEIEFDDEHKKQLVQFYEDVGNIKCVKLEDKLGEVLVPEESREYLKNMYESGYGLKVIARALGLTYTRIRTLFRYLKLEHRKGRDIVTEQVKQFRSERVKGDKSPWKDWPEKYPEMQKSNSKGIQGYYKKRDGSLVYLRSSWEYIFAKWLDKNNIDWKYEWKQYNLSNGENYRPDFFIFKNNELKMIVEIKGYYKNRTHKVDILREDLQGEIKVIRISNINNYTVFSENKEKNEWKKVRLLEKE